ncbi:hypothetical protein FF2_037421 [Malus domestica]
MSVVKESVIPVCNDIMAIPLFTFLNLTASQIILTRSSPFAFTHLFHIRYNSKDDLSAYTVHPWHMSMVKVLVLPVCDDIMVVNCDDIMVVNWALRSHYRDLQFV